MISKLLVADPKKRLSASGAINHPWMRKMKELDAQDNPEKGTATFN